MSESVRGAYTAARFNDEFGNLVYWQEWGSCWGNLIEQAFLSANNEPCNLYRAVVEKTTFFDHDVNMLKAEIDAYYALTRAQVFNVGDNLAYYADKANTYLNKVHRQLFGYTEPISDDFRLFIHAITEHVNAINALLETGVYL